MRLALLAALVLAPLAGAVPEAQAPGTHADVLRAWHEPAEVEPGQQWHGYLQLRPGAAPAWVGYQICNAGDGYCFAPTHDATSLGNGTYRFDTQDYQVSDGQGGMRPVAWQAGWTVGVRWFLADGSGNGTWVPRAPPAPTEQVAIADLYLTFQVPATGRQGAPASPPTLLAMALLAVAAVRRRRA